MKKFLAVLVVAMLLLCMNAVALGEEEVGDKCPPSPGITIDLIKIYQLTNQLMKSPEETFTFTITGVSVTNSLSTTVPAFDPAIYTIKFYENDAGGHDQRRGASLRMPTYTNVGIYTYAITETDGKTAGVTYAEPVFMKVYVIEKEGAIRIGAIHFENSAGEKLEYLVNTYSAGNLLIKKNVTGNMGEKDRYFKVMVTLTAPAGKTVRSEISVSRTSYTNPRTLTVGTTTALYLKHDETITLSNIPYGVTYTVVEDDYTGANYKPAAYVFTDDVGKLIDTPQDTVTITNDRQVDIDTGISLDNVPYMILIGLAVLGGVAFLMKRRYDAHRD